MSKDTVIIRDKAYFPLERVNMKRVIRNYRVYRYDHASCAKCEYLPDRHSYLCDQCEAFKGRIKLYSKVMIDGKKHIGLPVGDRDNMIDKAGLPSWIFKEIQDERTYPKLGIKDLEFVGKLRKVQKKLVSDWIESGYGQLQAPPRTGKTICMCAIVCEMKLRTLILANQGELLKQWLSEFRRFTNINDVEHMKGKELIGIAECEADFHKWPIVLSSYQKFISEKGVIRLEAVKKLFGLVLVDEVHKSAAHHFSKVVGKFWAKHKGGVTATPTRKDKLDFVPRSVIGPVVSVAKSQTLTAKVAVHLTGCKPSRKYTLWVYAMLFLSKDKMRNQIFVDYALKDIDKGHHILIPVTFVAHANLLTDMLNEALYKKYGKKNLAVAFHSKCGDREAILDKAKRGKYKVVVGMRSLIQAGINIPIWSCLYEIAPISNIPNHYQETQRICTPMDGKKTPLIRHFIDEQMGMSLGCFKTCFRLYNNKVKEYVDLGTKYEWLNEKHMDTAVNLLRMRHVDFGKKDTNEIYKFKVEKTKRGGGFGATKPHRW